jgi:UDP-N-acetylmuramate: L-alanyl-gamma-D-glutamyl-meso-diaminopimelate ligase
MKVHVTGVGGVAMGNLAAMLKSLGHQVSGSDRDLYPPMSDRLREWKIDAMPFNAKNVAGADLCIIGNVISRGNVEVEEILNRGLPYMSLPQALYEFFLKGRRVIVAAGTHGKTTTTFLMHHILTSCGIRAGLFAGGVRADGMDGFAVPDSDVFVIEGDEYDSAFFDKGSKFLHYRPRYLILNAVEFDHADIFKNFEDYALSFRRLLRMIPGNGLVTANRDDPGVRDVLKDYTFSPVEWFGAKKKEGVFSFKRKGTKLDLDGLGSTERFPLIGDYNVRNALAASRVALAMGLRPAQILTAMESFPGVLRRQQVRLNRADMPLTLIEDFAHHPTAVVQTIQAARQSFPGRRVHVFLEPRSATSHRNIFQKEYAAALSRADFAYMCDVHNPKKVRATERLNVRKVLSDAGRASGKSFRGVFGKEPADLVRAFRKAFVPAKKGDVILLLSNGAFGGIYSQMEEALRSVRPA